VGQRLFEDMSDEQFLDYLTMVCVDLRESGKDATADDYAEMIRRFQARRIESVKTS
jgi:hypothetical protein